MIARLHSLSKKNFIWIYFAIFNIGLFKFNYLLAGSAYTLMDFTSIIAPIHEWMGGGKDPRKLLILLQYIFTLASIFLFYGLCFCVHTYGKAPLVFKEFVANRRNNLYYWISILALNLFFLFATGFRLNLFFIIAWSLVFVSLPVLYLKSLIRNGVVKITSKLKISNIFHWVLIVIIVVQFFALFYPMIFKPMLVANEYMDIPEKTILKDNQVVDNTLFINEHQIGGLVKYDPRVDKGETPPALNATHIFLPADPMLSYFLKYSEGGTKYRYSYDQNTGKLILKGIMPAGERAALKKIYRKNPKAVLAINQLFELSQKQTVFYKTRVYSTEEKYFLTHNLNEMTNQARAGWFFFHHSWVLTPIFASNLGVNITSQPLIYGFSSTILIKKIMENLGGINYQNYFKVLFAFYPLYYLIFLIIIFLVFRRVDYLCIAALLLSCAVFGLTNEYIRIAPGYNPIRHFFDMPALLFFYWYLKNSKWQNLIYCLFVCLFSILWSKDLGICLLLAISATSIIKIALNGKKSHDTPNLFIVAFLSVIGLTLYLLPIGKNINFVYMLLGFGTPPTPRYYLYCTLIFISIGSLVYTRYIRSKEPIFLLSLSIFLYIQIGLIYFLWYPSHHHLLILTIPSVFLVLTWIFLYEKYTKTHCQYETKLSIFIFFITLVFMYIPSVSYFYYGRWQYNQIFSTHIVYDWTFKNAQFKSTMDPELFEQSMKMISQYEKHKHMYLISKYDSILSVISDKYNAIPTMNLALDLISERDTQRFIDIIKKSSPQYIFIDTDIARSFQGEVFEPNDPIAKHDRYEMSLGRAAMLDNLHDFYSRISMLYAPIHKGNLITVYEKRKS